LSLGGSGGERGRGRERGKPSFLIWTDKKHTRDESSGGYEKLINNND